MGLARDFHGNFIGLYGVLRGASKALPWHFHKTPLGLHGITVLPWDIHRYSVRLTWDLHGIFNVFQRFLATSMGLPWDSMGFYGTSMRLRGMVMKAPAIQLTIK